MSRPASRRPLRLEALENREVPATFASAFKIGDINGENEGKSIVTDAAGNVYATGYFDGTPDFDPGAAIVPLQSFADICDTYVTKTDPAGNLLWAKQFSGGYLTSPGGLAVDPQGNVVVAGFFVGQTDFNPGPQTHFLSSAANASAFVAKLDTNGGFLWARDFSGNNEAFGNAVTTDAEGNVISVGNFNGTFDFDPGPGTASLTSSGSQDGYVSKLDANGNFVWAKRYAGSSFVRANGVGTDASGNVYTTGSYQGPADFDPGPAVHILDENNYINVFVSKMDAAGNFIWADRIGGTASIQANGMAVDKEGNAVLTGFFSGTPDFDPGVGVFPLTSVSDSLDVFVAKVDADGGFEWARRFGGSAIDRGVGVTLDVDGGVYATGDFQGAVDFDPGPGSFPITATGTNAAFVHKLDADGDFEWAAAFVGTTRVYGTAVAVDRRGGVHTTGKFDGTADFNPAPGAGPSNVFNLTNNADYSIFTSKLTQASISGVVWDDGVVGDLQGGGSGLYTLGVSGVAGVAVELLDHNLQSLGVRVTDADGIYSFIDPPAINGDYRLQFRAPPGLAFSAQNQGGDDNYDSDPNAAGLTDPFPLTGDQVAVLDAGLNGIAPEFGFAVQAGSTESDEGWAVATAANGDVYVTGTFNGTVDFDPGPGVLNLTSAGFTDAYVAKYTSAGALAWARRFGGEENDTTAGIAVDKHGNAHTTGVFMGLVDFDPGPGSFPLNSQSGLYDAYVTKLDSDGTLVWARQLGGIQEEFVNGLALDGSGNVITTGTFKGTADFDPGPVVVNLTANGFNFQSVYVSKLDAAGNFVWARQFTGEDSVFVGGVAADSQGNVLTTGWFEGQADFDPSAAVHNLGGNGESSTFVSKLDAAGGFVWARQFDLTDHVGGGRVAADGRGNVLAIGTFEGPPVEPEEFGPLEGYVNKLSAAGDLVWTKPVGGSSGDVVVGVAADAQGNVYTTGSFDGATDFDPGPGVHILTSTGGGDAFVSKLDPAGNFILARRLGGPGFDRGQGVTVEADGDVFTVGTFNGTADFDPSAAESSLTSNGGEDAFLSKLEQAAVSGVVWDDQDFDGLRDVGEPLIAGAVAELIDSNGKSLGAQITGPDGAYSFIAPPDTTGGYRVQFRPSAGFGFASQDQGGDDSRDSDADPADGKTAEFPLAGHQTAVKDAGLAGFAPGFGFAVSTRGNASEEGRAVATDAAGNVYATGILSGTTDFDPGPGTYSLTSDGAQPDAYVAKYTARGALVWARKFGGTGIDVGNGIGVDSQGNVYTTGYFSISADFDPGPGSAVLTNSGSAAYVSKLDADGEFVWAKQFGNASNAAGYALTLDDAGSVFTTGIFHGTVDFDPGDGTASLTVAGNGDAYVSKLDADGGFVWVKALVGTGTATATGNGIAVDQAGNVVTTGNFSGTIDFNPNPGQTAPRTSGQFTDAYVSKLNSSGNFVWASTFGANGGDEGRGVAVDSAGNVYVTGLFASTVDFDPGAATFELTSPAASIDAYVLKLSAAGAFAWATQFGGDSDDQGRGIAVDDRGNVFTTGYFRGTADFDPGVGTTFNLTSAGPLSDVFLSELDSDGRFVLARRLGGSSGGAGDIGSGVAVDDHGRAYTTGLFYDTADFDPGPGAYPLTTVSFPPEAFVSQLVLANVEGVVWDDLDGDGTRDFGESGLAGATVELMDALDGGIGDDDDTAVETIVTGADGRYRFSDPVLGANRYIRISSPAGTAGLNPGTLNPATRRELTVPGPDNDVDGFGRSALFDLRYDAVQNWDAGFRSVPVTQYPGWAVGSGGDDVGRSVTTDADGNTYVVGFFTGTADFDPRPTLSTATSVGGRDAFVAKYNPFGALLWVRPMGGAGNDDARGVAVDGDGNVYVTGTINGAATFGALPPPAAIGGDDAFVAKLDPNGAFLWVKQLGGTSADTGVALALDAVGNVRATGMFQGSAVFATPSGTTTFTNEVNETDVYVVHLAASNGAPASAPLQIGGLADSEEQVEVSGIAVGPGGVFLAGAFTGTVDFNPGAGVLSHTSAGAVLFRDAFVVSLSADGTPAWAHRFGSSLSRDDVARAIALDDDGNVLVTGEFRDSVNFNGGAGGPKTLDSSSAFSDVFVCKITATGNTLWAKRLGGNNTDDSGAGIAADDRGYVYVTGDFTGTGDFDPGNDTVRTLSSEGTIDVFFTKLDAEGGWLLSGQMGGEWVDTAGGIAVHGQGDVRVVGTFAGMADLDPGFGSYWLTGAGNNAEVFVSQFSEYVIKGRVWEDLNGNGIQEPGEPELTTATVQLIDSVDGLVGNGNDVVLGTATTTDGGYEFIDPPESFGYFVRVTPAAAVSGNSLPVYVVSAPGQGNNPAIDSDINAAGESSVVRRTQGAVANLGAGFREKTLELGGWGLGGTGADKGRAVTTDAAGNTYVAGKFEGAVDFDPRAAVVSRTSSGLSDGFVAKYDPTGRLVWVRRLGGSANDEPTAIALDPSGNVLVTGTFEGTAGFEGTAITLAAHAAAGQTTNVRDVFVMRLSPAGDFQWARRLGGNKLEAAAGIAADKDGNVFTTGTFEGTADFDPAEPKLFNLVNARVNPPANTVSRDIFISKLNKDGNFVWAKRVGNIGDDTVAGVALDAAGNVYAAGHHDGTVDFNPGTPVSNLPGDGDYVLRLDNAGNYRWAVTYGNSVVSGIAVSGNNIYTAGQLLRRLDLDGNRVWERPLNGEHLAVAADAAGNVYTAGRFAGLLDFDTGPASLPLAADGTDAFVTKVSPAGEFIYARSLGGSGFDEGLGVAVDAGGAVHVTGSFQAAADFDISDTSQTVIAAGDADAFVWKLSGGGVRGNVWNDTDGNGLREPSEPAVGGAVVTLHRADTDAVVATQVSAADGSYRFAAPELGREYVVKVQLPVVPGLSFTPANQGGNDDLDSDADNLGRSAPFVPDPAIPTTRDAGIAGTIPPFGVAWTTTGPGESTAFANTVDAAGNVYVTGEFKGTVDFDPGSGSAALVSAGASKNAFVAKYTAAGILLWAKAFRSVNVTGGQDIGGQGVAVDAAGFVYVTGRFQGTADFGSGAPASSLVTRGGYDAFVTKLDPAGGFVWAGQIGGTGDDYGNGIAAGNGRAYVTGSFQGTADFDPGTGTTSVISFGSQDAFVAALTGAGALVWAKGVGGGGGDDAGRGIAADAAGSVFVSGSFSGTADFDPGTAVLDQTSNGLRDAFVWKLNSSGEIGTVGWAAQAGGSLNDDANGVAVGPDGNVVVAGAFTGTADFDRGPVLLEVLSNGATDAFVWQLSPTGTPVWAKGLGGTTSDAAAAVTADETGVYVAGSFSTFGTAADFDPGAGRLPLVSAANSVDAFVAKLDPAGNRQWAHRLGGNNNDAGLGVAVDQSGQVVFAGGLSAVATFDPGDGDQTLAGGAASFFFGRVNQTLAGEAFPLDSFEPNNTAMTATDLGVINVRAEIDGPSLSSSTDEDWFRYELLSTATDDDFVRLDIEPGHGDVELELFREGEGGAISSRTVGASTGHTGEIELTGLAGEPGVYFVRVAGAANPDYKLTLEVPKGFAKDAKEPNNTSAAATNLGTLTAPLSIPGLSINSAGDADWFAFDLADEGVASSEARIDFRNAQGDLELNLFDTNGNPLRASAGLDDSESVSLAGLPAGRYLVRVTGHDGATNPAYALTVRPPRPLTADIREPNNLPATATNLGALNGLNSWSDLSVHTTTDADWFKFTLTAAGQAGHFAAIDFVHAEGDLDLRLYEEANTTTPIAASTGNADSEQISLQGRAAGTYLLKVSGFATATQSAYTLRTVAPTAAINPDRLEGTTGNQTRLKASVVQTPGKTTLEGSQTLVDLTLTPGSPTTDEDWFKFTTVGKGTVQHNVIMSYPAANGTLGLELYNAAGGKIVTATGANGSLVASLKGLAKGTYYARTFIPKNGSAGSGYELAFDAPGSAATVAPDDWTVMVYMTADTLTERAFNDINEMETAVAGLPGSVNLAVMWDQSSGRTTYPTGNGTQKAWGTAGMALVSPDTNPSQIATKFEILPEKNTGDPATLKSFVEWAKKNAPANKYAIVFWDHGDGLRGFNFDTQDGQAATLGTSSNFLTSREVAEALAGQPKLDLIAFDACFMGVTETAHNLRDTANVVVASQDAIPGDGFEYDLALSALRTNPAAVTAEALATGLVQSFGARYGSTGRADTLSAVRTSALSELATALGAFSAAVRALGVTDDDKRTLVAIAAGSLLPSRSADTQRDLGSYLEIVAADGSVPAEIRSAATTAFEKLNRAVISRTSDLRGHSGLSVYLPVVSLDLLTIDPLRISSYGAEHSAFTTAAAWPELLASLRDGTDERPTDGDLDDKNGADNGSFGSATDLQLLGSAGISRTGLSLHTDNDEDWYKFQVSESGTTLEADITVGGTGGVIFAELRNSLNNLVAQSADNRVRLENAPAGTYYLHFYSNAPFIDNYSFTINPPAAPSDRSGSNTTPDKAFDLPSQLGETYAGYAVNAAGQDWLRFSTTPLPQPDLRRVTLTVSGGQSLRAQLRSPTGYVVSSAEGGGTLVLPYTASGAAETYTLVISNPNAVQVFYSLRLDSATATAAHPLDRFDRGNGEFTTTNQSDWTVSGTMRLEGGRVQITGAIGQALRKLDAESGDTGVQAKFKLGSGTAKQVVTVLARASLTNSKLNAYEARLEVFKGVATAIIYRTVNGLPSKLALGAGPKLAAGAEGVLRLEAQGQFLRLLVNGVPCVEFTDSFIMPPGRTGFAGTKDVLFDDFQANAITMAAPVGFSALPSGLGGEWQPLAGTFTAQQGNFVSGNATATALYNPARLADVLVSAGYSVTGPNQSVAVIARHNGAAKGSYYEAKVAQKATGGVTATLTRFVNGAAKVLQTVSTGVPGGGTVGLEVRGNELRLILNGAPQNVVIDKSVLLPGRAGVSASASLAVGNFTVTALAPRFADNFNRADNNFIGGNWDERPGLNLRIAGNRLTADAGVGEGMAIAQHAALANVSVSARVDLSAAVPHTVGLISRYNVSDGSHYEARLTPGATAGTVTAAIHRVGGSNPKLLKSLKFTKATAGTLQFDVEGSTLKLSLFGESISVTDTALTSAGQTGVRLGGGDWIDDFNVR